jgi:hypothetical protein
LIKKLHILLQILLLSAFSFSKEYQPRKYYHQKLEPVNKILSGAGQDINGFQNYWNDMRANEKPAVYMYYNNLNKIGTNWAKSLKEELLRYNDKMIVIQFGLELVGETEDIVAGKFDGDINDLLSGIQMLSLPVYIRLGYEFNGYDWNGYIPATYKAAFRYLTGKIRKQNLEIATVWNFTPDGLPNYLDFYPGDDVVDWWSINFFSPSNITDSVSIAFLDSADAHNRPVLIGEATPRFVGVLNGQKSWDTWFVPYFNLIRSQPGIKMISYINWNWADYPQWSKWGDARLEGNDVVKINFNKELANSIYFHAGSEADFRKVLEYNNPPR